MSISLEGSIRTCKVDTAWDVRAQSDRFFNPNQMICPVWDANGVIVATFYHRKAVYLPFNQENVCNRI